MTNYSDEYGVCGESETLDFNDKLTREKLLHTSIDIFLATIGIPLVWLIGIPTNLVFLFTIHRVPHMRTITNFYLANLALADILCLVLFPSLYRWAFLATPLAFNYQPKSWIHCALVVLSLDIPYFASNSLVTLVALERFYAICYPLKSRRVSSPRRAVTLVVVVWLLAVVISVSVCVRVITVRVLCVNWPDSDGNKFASLPGTVSFCTASKPWVFLYAHCMYFTFWVVGLLINSAMYFKIIRQLSHRAAGRSSSTNERDEKGRLIRNQVARMLVVKSIAYFLLHAPRIIAVNLFSIPAAASGLSVLHIGEVTVLAPLTYFLILINSTINPIIYSGTNVRYREAFLQAFGCCRRRKRASSRPTLGDMTISSRVTQR